MTSLMFHTTKKKKEYFLIDSVFVVLNNHFKIAFHKCIPHKIIWPIINNLTCYEKGFVIGSVVVPVSRAVQCKQHNLCLKWSSAGK